MIRAILLVAIIATAIGVGIELFRSLTNKEKWALTKTIGYAIMCSVIALVITTGIVILF